MLASVCNLKGFLKSAYAKTGVLGAQLFKVCQKHPDTQDPT